MSSDSTKPIIFISYAHADEQAKSRVQWLTFVMKYLRPAVKHGDFEVWTDREAEGGADWEEKIGQNLRACHIFVLLVSPNSMSSNYIIDKEILIARERQAAGDDLHVYPLLLEPTPNAGLDRVRDFNLRPRDARPFSSFPLSIRKQHMTDAANEIGEIAARIATHKARAAEAEPAAITSRASLPAFVHVSRLPETGYERLVGRDAELKRLNEAWSDHKTSILSLVAEGGAGKSALVNEWLSRLRADNYRGAAVVLGWSFYSQGSKERATAADEFLNWALTKLDVKVESTSASAKGEAIAEALGRRRVLLILDGVEPLQHGPGPQAGQLKDQGLRALLRRLAAAPPAADHSLIVLTSRVAVADIKRFENDAAPVVKVDHLSDEAGAELLRDNYVWGVEADLRSASRDFGGHPLALTLLASFLKETQNGDVRRRDHLRGLLADTDNPRHDQARRVMESYEKEWLAGQPILLAILHIVGLFDRPASGDCLTALRAKPIRGLTDGIVKLDEGEWRRAVARLREVRLLAPMDKSDPEAIDAHPLVREWFGEQLRRTNEGAWKAAHSRLYDHLRRTTHEGKTPKLPELAPLYHAIVHGCLAGRAPEALAEVYRKRISRLLSDGRTEAYSRNKLGAASSDLAAMAWFFDRPYVTSSPALSPSDRAWLFGETSSALRAQGRLQEALAAIQETLRWAEEDEHWQNATIAVSTLSLLQRLLGDIDAALESAEKSVSYAVLSGHRGHVLLRRAAQADALLAAGKLDKAEHLFIDAERVQSENTTSPFLYSVQGYFYCDLLLSLGRAANARERATWALTKARDMNLPLDIALNKVTIGRASHALAMTNPATGDSRGENAGLAAAALEEAVEALRASAEYVWLARGLIARAAFRRAIGDWGGATRDLDEAQEIAEPGPMRLYLCDIALERARLALAPIEGFAPLNGLVEAGPPPPALPDAAAMASLKDEARKQLDVARKLIADCGYHRRDEELAELDQVLAGRRRFADLPPRV
jgi:tetratricopeptide (TPR) repeat protein